MFWRIYIHDVEERQDEEDPRKDPLEDPAVLDRITLSNEVIVKQTK